MEHRSDAPGPKGRAFSNRRGCGTRTSILAIFCIFSSIFSPVSSVVSENSEVWQVAVVEPELISQVPHDDSAFTQGLEIYSGKFYESTGLYGESSVRIVNMETGQIETQYNLSDDYFAEGLTIWNNSVIQLTWKENIAFIYDTDSLQQIGNFSYQGEGWGICNFDETELWLSDGSGHLKYSNNSTVLFANSLEVLVGGGPSERWNELECIDTNEHILANKWFDDSIYLIQTSNGYVCEKVDFSSIREEFELESSGVLNGIAQDPKTGNYWITGKNWSNYYEVKIDFSNLSANCQINSSSDSPVDCLDCEKENQIGLVYATIVLALIWLTYTSISKRQTEKPPIISKDEQEAGEDV